LLVRAGYTGPVYMTEATADLVELSLKDAARVALENQAQGGEAPLYTEDDVIRLLNLIKRVKYGVEVEIGQLTVIFHDAGHILGSASIEISWQQSAGSSQQKIIFSGDLGNSPQDLIMPTETIKKADYVVMESTYGNRLHTLENPTDIIGQEINEIEKTGGTLLIPAFSLERTQEILHRIDHLKKSGKVKQETAIFLDSPLGITATEVFKKHTELYNAELSGHVKLDDPFDFPGLVVVEEGWQSKKIKDQDRAKVIIAGSGMMTGGRIMHHAIDFLPDPKTRVLIVGFMAENTLGRKLVDGEKNVFIDNVRVKKVFLTHGENEERQVVAEKIKEKLAFPEVYLPKLEEEVEL
ncbi:MBL fold metallo-hydrolase, partial [Candidatus Collierbacteria bacterium]|nr:MBL fold metallo-hydrolase [Candidatus Collierbacteria bacterium]